VIPVRVDPNVRPHIVRAGIVVAADHPLAFTSCPVCDRSLTDASVSLVFVGRDEPGWTAGAVAVHDRCAGPAATEGDDHE
jgi:hypothetical protein